MYGRPLRSTLFPYTTLFRSRRPKSTSTLECFVRTTASTKLSSERSEEHTSELQSQIHLVCRLLLEKKKVFGSREFTISYSSPLGFFARGLYFVTLLYCSDMT